MVEYPDSLAPDHWLKKKKVALPDPLPARLKALAGKHDAVDWKHYGGDWHARCTNAVALSEAYEAVAKRWRSEQSALGKAADEVETAAKALRKASGSGKSLDEALKSVLEAVGTYRASITGVSGTLSAARDAAAKAVAKAQASADEDEDAGADAVLDEDALLAQLLRCRKDAARRVHFGYGEAAGDQRARLSLHPRTTGKKLFATLQRVTGSRVGSFGTAWVDGMTLCLRPEKPYSNLAKKVRAPLKAIGFKVSKVIVLGPDDKPYEEDAEADAAPSDAKAATEDFKKRLKSLLAGLAIAGGPAEGVRDLMRQAGNMASVDEWKQAYALLDRAEEALARGGAAARGTATAENPLDQAYADAVFGGDAAPVPALRRALGTDRMAALHKTFGGTKGLVAVRRILEDVCGGDPAKLNELLVALD